MMAYGFTIDFLAPDHVTVASFEPVMLCSECAIVDAGVRPNWQQGRTLAT
jgi:hypothetical protein